MRFFYILLKVVYTYSLRLFFKRVKLINAPKTYFGRTIYVSNHASSFMDPLVIGGFRRSIVFFMTRSDIFTKFSNPFLRSAHMLPIYRQQDGVDTKDENQRVFEECAKIISSGRNLLVFGEGFTDDVFIRRLKPVKKGAVRIGFLTLEKMNWKKKVFLAAVGCNYTDPGKMRSEILISNSNKICLNDYKEEYYSNPNKTITDLTKRIEELLQNEITHVSDLTLTDFHEEVMILTRKGMNMENHDSKLSLENRWNYSRKLASWLNQLSEGQKVQITSIKERLDSYFRELKKRNVIDTDIWELQEYGSTQKSKLIFLLILLFPFVPLGLIHCALPYVLVKRFVEKSFKRAVFWSSVKLFLITIAIGLLNIPVIFIFPSKWIGISYYITIGLTGLLSYIWFTHLKTLLRKRRVNIELFASELKIRKDLLNELQALNHEI